MGKDQDLLQAVKDQDVAGTEKILAKHRGSKKIIGSAKRFNVNQQDGDGMSSLHHAALLGNMEIQKLLLDHGASVDIKDAKGMRPLHYAAWQGHARLTDMLLHQGSSVSDPAVDGNTPLHLACEHGHFEVVQKLLLRQADATVANGQHKTPLDVACEFGRTPVVERLLESESCRALLQDKSSDMADNSRTTCLHLAARNGHIDIIRMLLEAGIDVNRLTLQGTCLHEAAKYGKTDVVRLLLSCGIDVMRLNSYEQTALELVNKFTATRAARELKQLLKDASSDIRAQSVRDYERSGSQSPVITRDTSLAMEPNGVVGGTRKTGRNGLDSVDRGVLPTCAVTAVDANAPKMSQKHGKAFQWNRSSPLPSPNQLGHLERNACFDDVIHPPPSPRGKAALSNQDLNPSGGMFTHLGAHQAAVLQKGNSNERRSPESLGSSQPGWNGHPFGLDDGSSGSHRMSSGSSGSGSYQSSGGQSNGTRQNRLSGQSYESGVSGVSSGRQSYHSSSSSQGSLDRLEESGYSSTVNVHELIQQGLSDTDILHTWLSSLHLEELTSLFIDAGYDMPTISRMTPEDLTAIGITKPSVRKKLKSEISKLSISDGIPDYRPKDLSDWLKSLRLDGYVETLVKQGFGTLDTVTNITWEDLEEIGIKKLGHQKKMMLAIDRLKRINSILHRLSNSGQSAVDAANHLDFSGPGVKVLSRPQTSTPSSMSASFTSAPSHHHHPANVNEISCLKSWKSIAKENCSNPSEKHIITVERFGDSTVRAGSIEIHPVPPNRMSPCFPFSNMTSINHNTYPALPESFAQKEPEGSGVAADAMGKNAVLDGDATPTNERKVLTNCDHNQWMRNPGSKMKYSQEEPFGFHHFEQFDARQNGFSSYSTLPKKLSGKRKMFGPNDSLGFAGFLTSEDTGLSAAKQINRDVSRNLFVDEAGAQLMRSKKEAPPPPKRSNSFKTNMQSGLCSVGDRRTPGNQMFSVGGQLPNSISEKSADLSGVAGLNNNPANCRNAGVVAGARHVQNAGKVSSRHLATENSEKVRDESQKQPAACAIAPDANASPEGEWQDNRMSEGSDDSDSGLESRHSASSASLESNGSGSGVESNTLPFANENVGTIKQRNPSAKPSILSANGGSGELNMSIFDNGSTDTIRRSNRSNTERVENGNAQGSQFTLVNGEIINANEFNNGNMPQGMNNDSVFTDIDGMLSGLTQELDEMLKLHG